MLNLKDLCDSLPKERTISAVDLCALLGVECPSLFKDRMVGMPVSGLKTIFKSLRWGTVEMLESYPDEIASPTARIKRIQKSFSRKGDQKEKIEKLKETWKWENRELFQLLKISNADYDCTLSVVWEI